MRRIKLIYLHILLNSFMSNLRGHDCSFSIWGGGGTIARFRFLGVHRGHVPEPALQAEMSLLGTNAYVPPPMLGRDDCYSQVPTSENGRYHAIVRVYATSTSYIYTK